MKSRSFVLAIFACLLLLPSSVFAQDEASEDLDIRSRIAAMIESFVSGDDSAEILPATTDEQLVEDAPAFELEPQTVTTLVAIITVIFAVGLIVRGYQTPTKRDPFRSKL